MTEPRVLDCGHPVRPEDVIYYTAGSRVTVGDRVVTMTGTEVLFPGFARDHDGRTLCIPDADAGMRRLIETADALTVYDAGDHVTTWTGGILGRVVYRSTYRNARTGSRMTALTVQTPDGRMMTGRYGSDWSEAVTLRPWKMDRRTPR